MKLLPHEELALQMIFRGQDELSIEMRNRIESAEVLSREHTDIGFFANIKLVPHLSMVPEIRIREFNFDHPAFPYGGSYMCWFDSPDLIEIEAVTLGGVNWPNIVDHNLFSEIGI